MRTSPFQLSKLIFSVVLLVAGMMCSGQLSAQDFVVITEPVQKENINKPEGPVIREKLPSVYRFHKKLPAMYNGYAIEIAKAEYPMGKSEPIFKKFGNVKYHKLHEGGYSYLITTDFKNVEDAQAFYESIVKPKVETAKLIRYEYGIRRQP
jgi:hypothetical protein